MSALLITHEAGRDWQVWITLPGHDALLDPFGFVIGSGATRQDAVGEAVADLEQLIERLQSPPGVVAEHEVSIVIDSWKVST